MKKIYLAAAFLAALFTGKSLQAQQIVEEGWPVYFKQAMHYTWTSGNWVNDMRMTPHYDAQNRLDYILGEIPLSGNWNTAMKLVTTYDANGKQLTRGQMRYMNNTWIDYTTDTFRYNANGKVDNRISYKMNNSQWERNNLDHYIYDMQGRLKEILSEDVAVGSGQWENDDYYYYTYDAQGRLTDIKDQDWDGNAWVPKRKTHISFNAQGAVTEALSQDTSSVGWVNKEKFVFDSAFNVGIAKKSLPNMQLKLYPNPASSQLQVQLPVQQGSVQMRIYDISGRIVLAQVQGAAEDVRIDISGLPKGTYFLYCETAQGPAGSPFVKE